MKIKTINKINGGIAMYAGISCIIVAIGGLVGMGIFIYEVLFKEILFVWWQFALFLSIMIIMGGMGYVLFRIASEQLEE